LAVGDLRTDVTRPCKDGGRGRLYGEHRDPQAAFVVRVVDGAETAGELYGRAVVVMDGEQHAIRLVVRASQRMSATRCSSHRDTRPGH
jgi:hypothetical protein